MNINRILNSALVILALCFSVTTIANETTLEKAEASKNKVIDNAKGGYRDATDKVCETINGKTECIGKKIKNKANTTVDKTKSKAKELKNKIDY